MSALQCLEALTTLPYHKLAAHKAKVTAALAVPLDDHKRAVRKQAARCRNEWFVLGSASAGSAAGAAAGLAGGS